MPERPTTPSSRDEALAYIFEMATGLVKIAKKHDLRFLAYLLEMAALASADGGRGERRGRRLSG